MATYKGIQGYLVDTVSSDPTVSENVGRLWYNTTTNTWKLGTSASGSWATGGALNTARQTPGGAGTQTATLAFFGGAPLKSVAAETYDGTSWTNTTSGSGGRESGASIGQLQTAAAYVGGYGAPSPPLESRLTEIWNGSAWTESGDLNTGRSGFSGGAGTTAAGLVTGANITSAGATETFNGTSWTEVADLVTPRQYAPTTGLTSTAAMCVGGYGIPAASPYSNGPGSRVGITEIWDGTSWTHVTGTLNLGRISAGLAGTSTLAVIAGGSTGDPAPPTANTATAETWDGTSWTSVSSMADTNESSGSSSSSANAMISFGGWPGGSISASEEWTDPIYSTKTVTTS